MLVTIEKPSLQAIIIMSYIISIFIRSILYSLFIVQSKTICNQALMTMLMALGETLGGCVIFIVKLTKTKKKKHKLLINPGEDKLYFNLIHKAPEHKRLKFLTYFLILGLAAIDTFWMYIRLFYENTAQGAQLFNLIMMSIYFFFNVILTWKINKAKIYLHHVVGIIGVFLGYLISNSGGIIEEFEFFDAPLFLISFFLGGFASILEVYEKYIMDRKYINPFKLLFFQGLFGLIILLVAFVVCIILKSVHVNTYMLTILIKEFYDIPLMFLSVSNVFICLAYMILSMFVNLGFVLTIYYYNPISRIITEYNSLVVSWIYSQIFESSYLIIGIIGNLIQTIASLISFEILILYFCNLETYTKKEISLRSEKESYEGIELANYDNDLRFDNII